jgi:hypothetical protein
LTVLCFLTAPFLLVLGLSAVPLGDQLFRLYVYRPLELLVDRFGIVGAFLTCAAIIGLPLLTLPGPSGWCRGGLSQARAAHAGWAGVPTPLPRREHDVRLGHPRLGMALMLIGFLLWVYACFTGCTFLSWYWNLSSTVCAVSAGPLMVVGALLRFVPMDLGAILIGIGLLLWTGVCFVVDPNLVPGYWVEGAPAFYGLGAGVLTAGGALLLCRRFSLGALVLAVLLVGGMGTVGQVCGLYAKETPELYEDRYWFYGAKPSECLRLVNHGIVKTLVGRRALASHPLPARAYVQEHWEDCWTVRLEILPHADERARELREPVDSLVTHLQELHRYNDLPTLKPTRQAIAKVAAAGLFRDLAGCFGESAAREVAATCAALALDADLDAAFQRVAREGVPAPHGQSACLAVEPNGSP